MEKRLLKIYALDKQIDHEINMVHIFASKYSKKILKNEFHAPKSAKLIVENDQELVQYLLLSPIVKSDKDGNIELHIAYPYEMLIGKKPYYSQEEIKMSNGVNKLYHAKKNLGLSVSEMIEKDKYSSIADLTKVMKVKVPYIVGGGF